MRREIDWLVAGFCIVGFAVATAQARRTPIEAEPFVIDLRAGASDRVVLVLNQQPVVISSLPAIDESSLFGFPATPPREPEAAPAEPPAAVAAPRMTAMLRASPRRARAVRSRNASPAPVSVAAVEASRATMVTGELAPVQLEAPARRPGRAVALMDDGGPASQLSRPNVGFRLNERTSLNVGSLSSMVPSYAPEAKHGDFHERWRLQDEGDPTPGAAVGVTFKLN